MEQLGGIPEARMEATEHGFVPAEPGWWIANVADVAWATLPGGGTWCVFEGPTTRSPTLGIGVHVLWPGDTPGKYHAEGDQEGFLVLRGSCVVVVEGEERTLREWDYFHCPPGTAHITVGAGEAPCALLMVGTRVDGRTTYLPDPVAARHGAAVAQRTEDSREAYAGEPPATAVRSPWPGLRDPSEPGA